MRRDVLGLERVVADLRKVRATRVQVTDDRRLGGSARVHFVVPAAAVAAAIAHIEDVRWIEEAPEHIEDNVNTAGTNLDSIDLQDMADLYSAATGWVTSADDFKVISMRQLNMEKAFNLRHTDFGREDDNRFGGDIVMIADTFGLDGGNLVQYVQTLDHFAEHRISPSLGGFAFIIQKIIVFHIDEKLGLQKEKYRSNVILRNDGTTLYLTKDLALAKIKFERFHVDRSVYVVDVRQSLHLQQAFKILELWGFPQAVKCFHLGYGFVSLPEGAMSARRGRLVIFMDVANEAFRRVQAVIAEKNPELPEAERQLVAEQVGLGALAYAMLAVDNSKDIVFEMDAALNFDGHTAPYIQNAHVRTNSILKKAGGVPVQATYDYALSAHEVELIDLISRFPATVQQAAQEYKPLSIASYAYDLAKAFHSFYHVIPVLQTEQETIRNARLRLVAAARQTLANALRLLVIQAPDVM